MDKTEYSEFINHPLWRKKREDVFRFYGKKCSKCGSTKFPHVHHKTYARGKMPWEYPIENFIVLCERCHKASHGYEYTRNQCNVCGKEISEKFKLCIDCHNKIVSKKETEKKALERKIKALEETLQQNKSARTASTALDINRLEKERERMIAEKSTVEKSLSEMDRDRKREAQRIESQISSLRKLIVSAVVVIVALAAFFGLRSILSEKKDYISLNEVKPHIGKYVIVQGVISQIKYAKKGNIYLNMGGKYPRHKLELVIFKGKTSEFRNLSHLENKIVEVKGKISTYKGKPQPQIIINKESQIEVQ